MGLFRKILVSSGDIGRIVRAGRYSVSGLAAALRHEAAFRQEVILFVVLAPLGAWLGSDGMERALLIGSLLLVMIVELLNSSMEATVDRISRKRHKLSGQAKDMGSAAVLLSMLLALLVWTLILGDHYRFRY